MAAGNCGFAFLLSRQKGLKMGDYKSKPSWWQLVEAVRELCKISQLWNAGKITNESAMRSVCEILKGVNHV